MFLMPNNAANALSIKKVLFFWLVPIVTSFMILAWIIHGVLLDKVTESLIERQLESQGVELERQLRSILGQDEHTALLTTFIKDHIHQGVALKINHEIAVSTLWGPILQPILESLPENVDAIFYRTISLPESRDLIFHSKKFQLLNDEIVLLISEDISQLKASNLTLHYWTALVFLVLSFILLTLIFLSVNIALKPVKRLGVCLNELQTGIRDRLPDDSPPEFMGLVHEINHLLNSLEQRLQMSRQAIADLAHSVKTPVAAVRHMLTDFDFHLDKDHRARLANKLTDIDTHLEIEMHRVRFGGPQSGKWAKPLPQARELVWMFDRLHDTKQFELDTIIDEDHHWPIEEQDFNEIIGNLIDNSGKWAKHLVTVYISENNTYCRILVEDDGPGVDQENIEKIGSRSVRLNHEISGHGLGLSIVIDIVDRYQGVINFSNNRFGGFSVEVELPKKLHINNE
ncbi:MAG: two-component system sensor histidine kinase PhoQ [Chitinophagales bacterium]|jgi:two-component system sensor histidine kinase PhoQ